MAGSSLRTGLCGVCFGNTHQFLKNRLHSIHIRVSANVLEHLLTLLVEVLQIETLFVMSPLDTFLGLAEERSISTPVPVATALAKFSQFHLPTGSESFEQLVLQREHELGGTGVALTAGSTYTPQLIVELSPIEATQEFPNWQQLDQAN